MSRDGGDCSLLAPKIPLFSTGLGGLLPRKSSSSNELNRGAGGIGEAIPLTVGYTDFGRNPGVSTSVGIPDGEAVGDRGDGPSADIERKNPGLP